MIIANDGSVSSAAFLYRVVGTRQDAQKFHIYACVLSQVKKHSWNTFGTAWEIIYSLANVR